MARKPLEKFNKDFFELSAWQEGRVVCGIDEVGRGCLAGPVVTAAVILHPGKKSPLLKDSKLIDAPAREKAYRWIAKNSWYGISMLHHRAIDTHNIYQATRIAMKRAIMQVMTVAPSIPCKILIDAMPVHLTEPPFDTIDVLYFPKGERKSSSIAAASIVAKVTRDAMMRKLDPLVPGYSLANHKGYSTPKHKQHIKELGHSFIHRMSFLKNLHLTDGELESQQALFDLPPELLEPYLESE